MVQLSMHSGPWVSIIKTKPTKESIANQLNRSKSQSVSGHLGIWNALHFILTNNTTSRLGIDSAGWARQENTNVMPDATEMAGVDMRLEPGGYRELHWHVAAEWSLVLNGSCRIQVRVPSWGKSFFFTNRTPIQGSQ